MHDGRQIARTVTDSFQSIRVQRVRFFVIHGDERIAPVQHVVRPVLLTREIPPQNIVKQSIKERRLSRIARGEDARFGIPPEFLLLIEVLRAHELVPEVRLPILDRDRRHHAVPIEITLHESISLVHRRPVAQQRPDHLLRDLALHLGHPTHVFVRQPRHRGVSRRVILILPLERRRFFRGLAFLRRFHRRLHRARRRRAPSSRVASRDDRRPSHHHRASSTDRRASPHRRRAARRRRSRGRHRHRHRSRRRARRRPSLAGARGCDAPSVAALIVSSPREICSI